MSLPLFLQPLEIAEVLWWSSITLAVNKRTISHVFMICSCPFIHLANKHISQSPSFQHFSLKSTVIFSDLKKIHLCFEQKWDFFLTNKNLSGNVQQPKRKGCVLPRGNHDLKRLSSKKRKEKKSRDHSQAKTKAKTEKSLTCEGKGIMSLIPTRSRDKRRRDGGRWENMEDFGGAGGFETFMCSHPRTFPK